MVNRFLTKCSISNAKIAETPYISKPTIFLHTAKKYREKTDLIPLPKLSSVKVYFFRNLPNPSNRRLIKIEKDNISDTTKTICNFCERYTTTKLPSSASTLIILRQCINLYTSVCFKTNFISFTITQKY